MRSFSFMKINRRVIYYYILLIPFFPVQSIQMLGIANTYWIAVYNTIAVARLVVAALSIVCFMVNRESPNRLTLGVIAIELMTLLSCYINGTLTFRFSLTMCMATIGFAMLCQELDKRNEEYFLKANILFFGTLCFFGTLSILIFPNGLNNSPQKQFAIWFLGSKNSSYFYFAQLLFLLCYDAIFHYKNISKKTIIYALIFICCTFICNSSNGTVMLLILLAGIAAIKYHLLFRRFLKPNIVIMSVILLALAIPFLSSGALEWAFRAIGRTSDFSMRTYIWKSALDMIYNNPLFGNGKDGDLIFYGRQTQAHNFYIDIAAKYGILVVGFVIMTIIMVANNIRNTKNKELAFVGSLFLFTLLGHGLFDVMGMYYFVLTLFFCNKIAKDSKETVGHKRIQKTTQPITVNGMRR